MNARAAEAAILAPVFLAGCRERTQQSADPKAGSACMAAQRSNDGYVLVTTCEPLGREETYWGTWFVGLELSAFRKGYSGIPADLGTRPEDVFEIVVPTSLSEGAHAQHPQGISAYQVTFLGRESSLPWTHGRELLVADRILSLRRVPAGT
jgi:hypothetical protein